jgi:hypothetical protein
MASGPVGAVAMMRMLMEGHETHGHIGSGKLPPESTCLPNRLAIAPLCEHKRARCVTWT